MKRIVALAAVAAVALPSSVLAWGNTGHRILGEAAARAFPTEIPAFLRSRDAIRDIGELSREPDRSKGAGKVHDTDRDAAHFVDLGEDGRVLGGPAFLPLPATRADYEKALQAHKLDSWNAGYLQYAIIDRRQQLTSDFAYWRVLKAAEANPKWRRNRQFFRADRLRREALIFRTIGELSHFVGDGSQPLHVTVHYNGWGDYPNPQGFTKARIHGPFESDLVQKNVDPAKVAAGMAAMNPCDCAVDKRTSDYLSASGALVIPLYELEKAGGFSDQRGVDFATRQLAVGASELRDVVVEAWRASATVKIGWRPVAVADVLSGKTDPYPALYGID